MVTEAEALDKSHADLARRLADAGRKAESDAKVIAALRETLREIVDEANDLGHRDGVILTRMRQCAIDALAKYEQTFGESK